MKRNSVDVCRDSEWVYRQFARENEIDYLQLRLIDMLYCRSGRMSMHQVHECLPCSRLVLHETLEDLIAQDLIECDADIVRLSEFAPFVIEDILAELHDKLSSVADLAGRNEDETPHLSA